MHNDWQIFLELLPKLGVATVCGGLIGIEREIKNKVAGVRTHILICVGVAILTYVGTIFTDHADPTRVIGQIVTGIGFLGAGVIFKQNDKVTGVTSAAFIWFISAIGVLCGLNFIISASLITVLYLILTIILKRLEATYIDNNPDKI